MQTDHTNIISILRTDPEYAVKSGSGWIIGFAQIITLTIFISLIVFILFRMDSFRSGLYDITEQNNRKSELIYVMYTSGRERVLSLYRMLDTEDAFDRDDIFQVFNLLGGNFANARDELMAMELEPDERKLLEEQGELAAIVTPQLADLTDKIQNEELDEARFILNNQSIQTQTRLLSKLEELLTIQQQKTQQITESIDKQFNENKLYTILW